MRTSRNVGGEIINHENSPIVVENKDLIFDFSKDEYLELGDHSISGLVDNKAVPYHNML